MELTAFWRWWTAGTTSGLGTAVGGVALPLTALTVLHASAFEMGLISAAGYLAYLVISLPAGVIVQRLPVRGIQVGADLVRAVAVTSIPLAWWLDALTVAQLVGVALVMGFADVLFAVANQTFLPAIVPAEQLQARNSLTSGTHAATELGGPSLGGFAVQILGAVPTLLVDAVSYLISAAFLRTLPARPVDAGSRSPMFSQIREGWHYVARHPVMAPGMWAATAVNFVNGAHHALFAFYLVRDLHAAPVLVGVLLAADGLGSLIGAALTTRFTGRFGTARGLIIAGFTGVAGALLIPAGGYLAFAAGTLIFAGSVVVLSVTTRTYRMIVSPPELLSRVIATVRFVSWGAIPIGGLLAGALAGLIGTRATLFGFGLVTLCAPLFWLFSPVRRERDLPLPGSSASVVQGPVVPQ
ncbi:putative MFS transporter [Actinoplanes missouriensis 431]|uniref:Putative MFS transporter n=1 Tax=Actinoplanes missouriensis (strain ATCC 14538 / DSM 43046 / CBS 188.64 / JCM 3121 / NBRC 102363 / NCIMB 12654 / NRRL B-3342 / UNCC 431) TaxID=512565 RepID=I0H3L5_ACTM4|nr:MFS transporter [Actinoplanes missouriensis]BAL87602.1 putative MFS transporter [Actinoplanes missouriensis 431]